MQKNIFILLFCSFLISACNSKEKKNVDEVDTTSNSYSYESLSKERFKKWINYYKENEPGFEFDNFLKENTFKIIKQPTTTPASFSNDFNKRYKSFLAYNADSTMYVDIDSYLLQFNDKGSVDYNADQEIILVDITKKEASRILFYGPSFWVEDAFFKNDSTLILLENSNDRVPGYQEINLNTLTSIPFTYKDTLNFDSKFYNYRVNEILKQNQSL